MLSYSIIARTKVGVKTAGLLLIAGLVGVVDGQGCGEQLTPLEGNLTHPGYPENYGDDANCQWSTRARDRDDVFFRFFLLDVEQDRNGGCSYDYVSIKFSTDQEPKKFCGRPQNRDPGEDLTKEGRGDPVIKFVTDDSVNHSGFLLHYRVERFDYCGSGPCENGGSCIPEDEEEEGWRCACAGGWTGMVCSEDLDECTDEPCQNGGTCSTPQFDMYSCACADGFTGKDCETDIDECSSSPCRNNATCVDGNNQYSCACAPGFAGTHCQSDIDECESQPCQHEGECQDGRDSFQCRCVGGFEGRLCETETDECASSPCQNGATCQDDVNRFSCKCAEGYEGAMCDEEHGVCSSNPCRNNATCNVADDGYHCACVDGFTGSHCDVDVDECESSPCRNEASCRNRPGSYECVCREGFSGEDCQNDAGENPHNDDGVNESPDGGSSDGNEGGSNDGNEYDHWRFLSVILPALLFLILAAVLALLFLYLFRKKRKRSDRVRVIKVKPAKDSKRREKSKRRDKRRKKSKRRKAGVARSDTDSSDVISVENDLDRRPVAYVGKLREASKPSPLQILYPAYQGAVDRRQVMFAGGVLNTNPPLDLPHYRALAPPAYGHSSQRDHPVVGPQQYLQPHHPPPPDPYIRECDHRLPADYHLPANYNLSADRHLPAQCHLPADHHLPTDHRIPADRDQFDSDDLSYDGAERELTSSRAPHNRRKPCRRLDAACSVVTGGRTSPPHSDVSSIYDGGKACHNHEAPPRSDRSVREKRESDIAEAPRCSRGSRGESGPNNRAPSIQPGRSIRESENTRSRTDLSDVTVGNADSVVTRRRDQARAGHWQDRDDKKLNCIPTAHKCYQIDNSLQPTDVIKRPHDHTPRYYRNDSEQRQGVNNRLSDRTQQPAAKNHKFGRSSQDKSRSKKSNILSSGLRNLASRGAPARKSQVRSSLTPITEEPLREAHEDSAHRPRRFKGFAEVPADGGDVMRHPPEGGISSPDEAEEHKGARPDKPCKEDTKLSFFKLIRKSNSLNINRARGLARENAFIQRS